MPAANPQNKRLDGKILQGNAPNSPSPVRVQPGASECGFHCGRIDSRRGGEELIENRIGVKIGIRADTMRNVLDKAAEQVERFSAGDSRAHHQGLAGGEGAGVQGGVGGGGFA